MAAILLGCIFLTGCENDESQVKKINSRKIGVEEARNVDINYTIGGKSKSVIHAPLMLNVQEATPYIEFPQSVHADFFDEQELPESKLDARYARYQQYQSVILLRDSVVVINMTQGDTLYCDELYWDRNRYGREFYTDKPVRIRTRTETINGKGMEASQNFRNWHILQSVGNISVPASKFPG